MPWFEQRTHGVEFNPGNGQPCQVNVEANQTVTIEKLYGPLCANSVRVRLEYHGDTSDWVVESEVLEDGEETGPDGVPYKATKVTWVERARWDCQDGMRETDNE